MYLNSLFSAQMVPDLYRLGQAYVKGDYVAETLHDEVILQTEVEII